MVHGVSPLLIEILAGINQQDTPLLLSLRTPEITITPLALQANLALEEIRGPLMLTDDELVQVANWLNKHHELTGVS